MPDMFLDVCSLQPPEPMERIMEALATLEPQQRLAVMIDRQPHPLYGLLERKGYRHSIALRPDQRYDLLIWRAIP